MLITIIENNIVQDSAWHLKDYVSYFLVLIGWAFISHQNKAGFKRNELRLYINKIQEMYEATIKLTLQFYLSKDSNPALQRNEILNFLELLHTKISPVSFTPIRPSSRLSARICIWLSCLRLLAYIRSKL